MTAAQIQRALQPRLRGHGHIRVRRRMGSTLTIAHCFDSEWSGREVALPVAQLRMRDGGCVGLYWRRGSGRWSPYRREHEAPFHGTLHECLAEIAADRWGCFWN